MTKIGPILSADGLEDAVKVTLSTWFPTYLNEIRLQRLETVVLPSPRSYMQSPEIEHFLEDQLPSVVIISPGLAEEPYHDADGFYHAKYTVGIAIICGASDRDSTNRNVKRYAAAARAILLQHASLGGYANGIDWQGEDFDQGPSDSERTLGVAALTFTVDVAEIVNRWSGPDVPIPPTPDTIPGSEWPAVLTPILNPIGKKG